MQIAYIVFYAIMCFLLYALVSGLRGTYKASYTSKVDNATAKSARISTIITISIVLYVTILCVCHQLNIISIAFYI